MEAALTILEPVIRDTAGIDAPARWLALRLLEWQPDSKKESSRSPYRALQSAVRLCLLLALVPITGTPRAFDRAGRLI